MPSIYGYIHVYQTERGLSIFRQLLNSLVKSRLLESTRSILVGFVGGDPVSPRLAIPSDYFDYTKILDCRHDFNPLLYEGFTLDLLHSRCTCDDELNDDDLVWYIHTKGATATTPHSCEWSDLWRQQMVDVVINRWQYCRHRLLDDPTLDIYGGHRFLRRDARYFIPGNFWWSRASHIKRLPPPFEWPRICGTMGTDRERFAYEHWISRSYSKTYLDGFYTWSDDITVLRSQYLDTSSRSPSPRR